jgi:tetratricopeptide (TPR) repeat protein
MIPLVGDIKDMTIPWLFQDLRKGRKTGTALFEQDAAIKKVFFNQGDVLFAASNKDYDRLGEFLLRTRKINQTQFDTSSDVVIRTGKKLGTVLFEAGALSPHDLVDQVRLQVKQIILSLFGWRSGRYRFDSGPLPLAEIVPLAMSTGDLIIEGLRGLDGKVAGASLPPHQTILRPATDPALLFQKAQLDQDQLAIIPFIDGGNTIQEIACLCGLDETAAHKAIYVLLALRMAERGEIKPPDEKDFVCELVRETFAARQTQKADPAAAEALFMKQTIQSAFESLGIQSYYEVLGVNHSASAEEIKKAYFRLAKLYHPDRHFEPQMSDMKKKLEALFTRLHEAYETLSSPVARNKYNVSRASGSAQHGAATRTGAGTTDTKAAAAIQFDEGMKQYAVGNYWAADEAFQEACRLEPDNAEYAYRLGLALSHMPRRGRDAEEYFIKAIEMAPKKPEYSLELGNFYFRAEQRARALSVLQDALKHHPDSEKIKEAIKKAGP